MTLLKLSNIFNLILYFVFQMNNFILKLILAFS